MVIFSFRPEATMVYYKKYCENNTSGGVFYDEEKG